MKRFLLSTSLITLLSACSVGTPGMSIGLGLGTAIGSNVGLGTSINIPVRFDPKQNSQNNGGVNIIEEQIITYFDAHGQTSNQAVKGGFYRQLLNKRGNEYVVQDFYSDNSRKRTDPYILSREQLMQFRATPNNGSLTTYAYNGNIMQQQAFQNGKLVGARY